MPETLYRVQFEDEILGPFYLKPSWICALLKMCLLCNLNNPKIGGEMAEIFAYPFQLREASNSTMQ